jgi:AcrR family transcriptional regulator
MVMARSKQYNEQEVVEKAMFLFWLKGYENTSVRMLEKEMGINQFSIYASFGSKQGVFLESLKCYKSKVNSMFDKLKNANNGVNDIKEFFSDSIKITAEIGNQKGCLLTNTYNEFVGGKDENIKAQMTVLMSNLKELFIEKLRIDKLKDEETVLKQANYLLLAKHGLAAASRVNNKQEIEDYIELTFKNL